MIPTSVKYFFVGYSHSEAYLDDNTWRLGEVPEWQAKQTHEGCLGLICLRAAGTEDAAT